MIGFYLLRDPNFFTVFRHRSLDSLGDIVNRPAVVWTEGPLSLNYSPLLRQILRALRGLRGHHHARAETVTRNAPAGRQRQVRAVQLSGSPGLL